MKVHFYQPSPFEGKLLEAKSPAVFSVEPVKAAKGQKRTRIIPVEVCDDSGKPLSRAFLMLDFASGKLFLDRIFVE